MNQKYRSIFISDVHLGTKECKADYLCEFLKQNDCERLYLVGDIVDAWQLAKKVYWPQSHSNVIRRILTKAKRGTRVYYILGNHDEILRNWLGFGLKFGRIRIMNEQVHETVDGRLLLVTHGDLFDGITVMAPWLAWLGDSAYQLALWMNNIFNRTRSLIGMDYWSMSKFLKHNVKRAVSFIFEFEKNLAQMCHKQGYAGVICGHIHTPEMKEINQVLYMNCGDWVESCTALVEHMDGRFELIHWKEIDHESHVEVPHE
jgi:UDP-2,3-diacylglucosamine pyrophosphatase LpxH